LWREGCTTRVIVNKIILTFDDGPNPETTPRILDALANTTVQAVFFVLGEKVQAPGGLDLVRRAAAEGHLIGNHTFSHPRLTELSPADARCQILRTHELIAEFEPRHKLFRPPYGACNDTVRAIVKELNYEMVLWNADFEDWRTENQPSAWVDIAVKQIAPQPLAICLGHDLLHTAEHLPRLLKELKELSDRKFVRYDRRKDLEWLLRGLGSRVGRGLSLVFSQGPSGE
jgi:peptidoglycan-N-acetylglucosamine deacetylase